MTWMLQRILCREIQSLHTHHESLGLSNIERVELVAGTPCVVVANIESTSPPFQQLLSMPHTLRVLGNKFKYGSIHFFRMGGAQEVMATGDNKQLGVWAVVK